jgi:predicted unusual protein kinase regulating ubiquinone biosynthesis (AarF/ABC1/UbiB family)
VLRLTWSIVGEARAKSSALRRNAEVWKFALKSVFRVLKPRKMRKKGASEAEVKEAQIAAAEFIRDGLLDLGPSFVKLGQVMSTRTDVLPTTYTDVLKTLTDEVPGFDGKRAKEIVSKELGRPCDEVFKNFSRQPVKAASLGQVHTATYNGRKVAIKVQRAGLKELFDLDLKNLKKVRHYCSQQELHLSPLFAYALVFASLPFSWTNSILNPTVPIVTGSVSMRNQSACCIWRLTT